MKYTNLSLFTFIFRNGGTGDGYSADQAAAEFQLDPAVVRALVEKCARLPSIVMERNSTDSSALSYKVAK